MSKVKFNFIDALIILVILLAVLAGGYFLASGKLSAKSGGEAVKIQYQVEIKEKTEEYSGKIKIGDKVLVGDKEKASAVVEGVEVVPFKIISEDKTQGIVHYSEVPDTYDVIITLSSEGSHTDKEIYADNTQIRIGEKITVRGNGYSGNGYILGLEITEQEESRNE